MRCWFETKTFFTLNSIIYFWPRQSPYSNHQWCTSSYISASWLFCTSLDVTQFLAEFRTYDIPKNGSMRYLYYSLYIYLSTLYSITMDIRGFCDGRMFVVHLGCKYSPQILANVFLHGQGRGWGHVILRGIFILANWEKHCIRVSENTTQYPRILISISVTWSRLFLSVCKYILILILNSILII